MKDHVKEIDHIIHDLEQIEHTKFDEHPEMDAVEHTRILAKEAIDEFMSLIQNLEKEEFDHSGIIYDSLMLRKMVMAALYMSRYGHTNLFKMDLTFEETCEECARLIGCNPEGIIHMKTLFDNYFTIKEVGWDQKIDLSDDMMVIMNECDGMTDEEMALACRMEFRKKSAWH